MYGAMRKYFLETDNLNLEGLEELFPCYLLWLICNKQTTTLTLLKPVHRELNGIILTE